MRRLTIAMLLVAAGLWPTILESGDLTAYYVRYPCVIMQCQDWHYVLEAPGGKIVKVEENGHQALGGQLAEEIEV